jgi:hypothetical protein
MSIFGKIMSSIFGKASAAGAAPATPAAGAKPSSATTASAAAGSIAEVDVAGILTKLAAEKRRKSIIDLMKVLDLDSSLSARKELAQELHYSGDMNDTASMNVWLHKQVMRKLAENGGKVPEQLKT